jgi:hypothetical protein
VGSWQSFCTPTCPTWRVTVTLVLVSPREEGPPAAWREMMTVRGVGQWITTVKLWALGSYAAICGFTATSPVRAPDRRQALRGAVILAGLSPTL